MAKKNSYGGGIAGAMARAQERRDRKKAEMNASDSTDSLRKRKRKKRKKRRDKQDTSSTLKTSRIKKRVRKSVSKLTKKISNTQGKIVSSFNTFGKPEDNIELNIYDNTDTLVAHIRDFKDYTFTEEGKTPEGLSNEVLVDPVTNLRNLNFNSGQFHNLEEDYYSSTTNAGAGKYNTFQEFIIQRNSLTSFRFSVFQVPFKPFALLNGISQFCKAIS